MTNKVKLINEFKLNDIKNMAKELKKLPKKEKVHTTSEVLEELKEQIFDLHQNKNYTAENIVLELKSLGVKATLKKIKSILMGLEETPKETVINEIEKKLEKEIKK